MTRCDHGEWSSRCTACRYDRLAAGQALLLFAVLLLAGYLVGRAEDVQAAHEKARDAGRIEAARDSGAWDR